MKANRGFERIRMTLAEPDIENGTVHVGFMADMVGYHLRRALGAFNADYARAFSGTGMRQGLFGILSVIAANPGINQGAVARALGIQRANMVALINELGGLGYVERGASAEDRRAFTLRLTDKGKATLEEACARARKHDARMLGGLSPDEREALIAMLMRIAAVDHQSA
jgi:DNA-binding MarR family transcriptional regulator